MGNYHDKFINALNKKSYEQAIKILEDSEYRHFYQYRAWDDYTEKNIREGNIILSNPMDFNDIFDLFYKVNWSEIFINKQDEKMKIQYQTIRSLMQN